MRSPTCSDVQVIVYTDWDGRSPDLVEDQITYPISTRIHRRAEGEIRARGVHVWEVVRLCHFRGWHGYLLGALAGAANISIPFAIPCPKA
ncbi:MAG: hypothetical protein QM796_20025 [Chthoniobacteraceae bacterium]